MPINTAFGISELDILNVLRADTGATGDTPKINAMAVAVREFEEWPMELHDRVAKAALDADLGEDDDLGAQTDAAYAEIRTILVERGVISR